MNAKKWLFPVLVVLLVPLWFAGCDEDDTKLELQGKSKNIPSYTVLSLPAPVMKGGSLIWSAALGGSILFDDPLLTPTALTTFTVAGTFDGNNPVDGSAMQVNLLGGPGSGNTGIEVIILLDPDTVNAPTTIYLLIIDLESGGFCPNQTIVDTSFVAGTLFSFTIQVDQSGATPAVSVWLTGSPSAGAATYTSAAADCTASSATWVISNNNRVWMEGVDTTNTSITF